VVVVVVVCARIGEGRARAAKNAHAEKADAALINTREVLVMSKVLRLQLTRPG
jgi:hypothetical protein